jgi:hypothetical protein
VNLRSGLNAMHHERNERMELIVAKLVVAARNWRRIL